jgi:hypothetical protein
MGQAVVLKSNGGLAAWGSNADGQLGNARALFVATPGQLAQLPDIAQVAASQEHVVALDSKGRVWTWGAANSGRLGSRAQRNPALPGRVRGIQDVIAVAASDYASFALKADGTVWFWGSTLGDWTAKSPEPRRLTELSDIAQISAGFDHLVMRTRAGTVVTFGRNDHGQIGTGVIDGAKGAFVVPGLSNVTWVTAGTTSSFAITAAGQLHGWGQLHWTAPDFPAPALMAGFPRPVSRVSARANTFALLDDGTVWLVGSTDGVRYLPLRNRSRGSPTSRRSRCRGCSIHPSSRGIPPARCSYPRTTSMENSATVSRAKGHGWSRAFPWLRLRRRWRSEPTAWSR